MTSVLATLLLAQVPVDQPPRLRTLLPNGAVVLVEKMPSERVVSVQLWASSRSVRETPQTHGWRHLLEHLMVRRDGSIDRRLETVGGFLTANTYRDAMQIEVRVAPDQLPRAMQAFREVLKPLDVTEDSIKREVSVMAEEFALREPSNLLSSAIWSKGYGDEGLDPLGTLETMGKATPDALRQIQRSHFYPENLVMVIAGPVDLDEATKQAATVIGTRQGATKAAEPTRALGKAGRAEVECPGAAVGALVDGYGEPSTAATLAAALAIGSEVEGAFVIYTPTAQRGVVIVGHPTDRNAVATAIGSFGASDTPLLYNRGRAMVRAWVNNYLSTPSGVGYLRGLLLTQGLGYRPEQMMEAVETLSLDAFRAALDKFKSEKAVTAVGEAR